MFAVPKANRLPEDYLHHMTKYQVVIELFKVYFESNGLQPNSSSLRAASASSSSTTTLVAPIAPPQAKADTRPKRTRSLIFQ